MFTIYASNYAPINPLVPPCDINLIPIGYVGENLARCLVFDLSECVEQFGDGGFVISFLRHGDELPYLVTNTDRLEDNAIWNITDTDTAVDGYGLVQLQYIVDDVVCKSALYRTVTFESNGITGDVPDPYEDLLAQIAAYASTAQSSAAAAVAAAETATTAVEEGVKTERSQRIAADEDLQTQITSLMGAVGTPLTTSVASQMTDISKIYVYTGNETGYTYGNWYYYNGAEWTSGGVYNATALETDKTLTVEGMAADAAATGDLKSQIMSAFVTEQASGSIASFDDGADGVPVKDLVVNITPQQAGSGDPSPSNVRTISGFTAANITRAGKNLLFINYAGSTANGVTATVTADKRISFTGTSTGNSIFTFNSAIKLPAGQYSVSGQDGGNADVYLSVLEYLNGTYTGVIVNDRGSGATFTSKGLDYTYTCRAVVYAAAGALSNYTISPMIRPISDTDATFEPYNANVYNISFASAGTVYGGTLDVTTGMLTVTHAYKQFSNLVWAYNSSYGSFYCYLNDKSTESMCDRYPRVVAWSTFLNTDNAYWSAGTTLYVRDADYTTVDAFLAAMGDAQFVYSLANPISVQLSATEVRTLLGNNNIWSDTGSVASCEYRADTQLYIEKLTNPDSDMTADSNIASGQYFMVNNTLYLATAAIASGATIVPGTNCTETSLAAALNAINA